MSIDPHFDASSLARIEPILLAHPIAQRYFKGMLYDIQGQCLTRLLIERPPEAPLLLDSSTAGRLFMIPDGSIVTALRVNARDYAPAGFNIRANNTFQADDEVSSVIVFREPVGSVLWIDALHISNMMLAPTAPARLTTVAFGLMAVTAYRLGFHHISLYAAGRGPLLDMDPDAMVGYAVWPKFGFDASIHPVELNRFPALSQLGTVQDIRRTIPGWWEKYGSGRSMVFELHAGSRSWSLLLNYLYNTLQRDSP